MRYAVMLLIMLLLVSVLPVSGFASTNLQVHRVESGDTLYDLAERYGTDISELMELNPISDINYLAIDQILIVPGLLTEDYQVKAGDTLYSIARNYQVDIEELGELNNLEDLDKIYIDQVLEIPITHTSRENGYQGGFNFAENTEDIIYRDESPSSDEANDKRIALTFDDGPDDYYTSEILEILQAADASATFYYVGEQIEKYPEVVKQTFEEGHEIGNHSWSHPDFRYLDSDKLANEISSTEELIHQKIGERPAQMRPPYGALNEEALSLLIDEGYHVVNWSIDTWDWLDKHSDLIHINTLPYFRDGAIVLMHSAAGGNGDSREHLLQALPEMIATLQSQGYELVTVSELIDRSPYQ